MPDPTAVRRISLAASSSCSGMKCSGYDLRSVAFGSAGTTGVFVIGLPQSGTGYPASVIEHSRGNRYVSGVSAKAAELSKITPASVISSFTNIIVFCAVYRAAFIRTALFSLDSEVQSTRADRLDPMIRYTGSIATKANVRFGSEADIKRTLFETYLLIRNGFFSTKKRKLSCPFEP